MLELEGNDDLDELALDAFFRGEEEATRQLHGERRSTLAVVAVAQVVDRGAEKAKVIHAAMLEEAAVLDRGDGGNKIFWQLVVGDEPALGTIFVGKAGDQQRLQLIGSELLPVVACDLVDAALVEADRGPIL